MYRRLISILLAFALMVGACPVTVSAAATNDYTQWKQYDAEWNSSEAWPKSQYPGATLYYMRDAGCLVTSIAMLLRHYNVVTESDVNKFNPWIVNNTLASNGALDSAADVKWYDIQTAYPGFAYQGYCGYSLGELKNIYNAGYACIVQVMGSGGYYHFVAVRSIDGDNVIIMDPGSENTSLSAYGSVYTIHYFSATPSNVPYVEKCTSYPSHCTIQVTKEAYVMSQPCSSGTDSSSTYIETIRKDTMLTAVGVYLNTQGNLWYKITTPKGAEAFIPSSHTAFKNHVNTDISLSGNNEPENIDLGAVYSIAGEIKAYRNELTSVYTHVYRGTEPNWEWMTGGSDVPSNNSYTLNRSNIDNRVLFNELPTGAYTYVIGADYKGYYAVNEKTLGTYSGSVRLHENMFSVGGAPLTKTYTIHYDANGGFDTPEDQQKVYGEDLTLTSEEPKKLGYSFQGWSTNATASSATYTRGSAYTVNAGTTLYAVWKAEPSYTVTYYPNGGVGGPQNQELPYGHPATFSTIAPRKEGYDFIGWSTDPDATVAEFSPGYGYDKYESITLYATWRKLSDINNNESTELRIATEPTTEEYDSSTEESMEINNEHYITICQGQLRQYKVIPSGEDLLMSGEDLAEISGYSYSIEGNNAYFTRGTKEIRLDAQKNRIYYFDDNKWVDPLIEKIEIEDDLWYFPVAQLLPWLNVTCTVENGVLYVFPDACSIWEIIEEFDPEEIAFDYISCCNDLGINSKWLKAAAYVAENGAGMIKDILPVSYGISLGTIQDYYDIFDEMFQNKESVAYAYHELIEEKSDFLSAFNLSGVLGELTNVPDVFKDLAALAKTFENVETAHDFAVFYASCQSDNDDKLTMMSSITLNGDNYNYPEAMVAAAMQVSDAYENVWKGIETKFVYTVGDMSIDGLTDSATGFAETAFSLLGIPSSLDWSWTTGIERISQYDAIGDIALDVYKSCKNLSGRSSIRDARCHAQLFLYASEMNWRAMAAYAEHKGKSDLAEAYLAKAEAALRWQGRFLATASAEINDSHEYGNKNNKDQYSAELIEMFKVLS